jgi:type VI secretion system protein ImpE
LLHTKASEKFREGDLKGAVDAAIAAAKEKPTDTAARGFLCEMLAFTGEYRRADKQLDLIADQAPDAASGVALFRQLLRGAMARYEVFHEGRAPELLEQPPAHLQLALRGLAALREGDRAEAANLVEQAEAARPAVAGRRDASGFADWRDLNDVTASVLEVITSTGKYYWVPLECVAHIAFEAPKRPRDLLWRQASIHVHGGPEGVVYIPAIYPGTSACEDDGLRLGRATIWKEDAGPPVAGQGQRTFLFDETDLPIMELGTIETYPPGDPATGNTATGGAAW